MTHAAGDRRIAFLDHTADVGIEVTAPSPEAVFDGAALGMLALLHGQEEDDAAGASFRVAGESATDSDGEETAPLELEADGRAELLARWLKELLFLHEVEHRDYVEATFRQLTETHLEARIATRPAAPAAREIKGVTYHELTVERTEHGWKARVIFDV